MNRVFICSLKYSPGLYKEIVVLVNNFNKFAPTSAILSEGYINAYKKDLSIKFLTNGIGIKGMISDILMFPYHFIKLFVFCKTKKTKNIFLFYNPHPLNFIYGFFIKNLINESFICTVLHEPYKSNKEKSRYGFKKFIYYYIVEIAQKFSVSLSEVIITMSPYGSILFKSKFPNYRGLHIKSNLLISREEQLEKFKINRFYFSFIGTITRAKGIFEFIDLVNYSLKRDDDMKFCLITSSKLDQYIPLLNDNYQIKLKIINKKNISDQEINYIIKSSLGVFSIHNIASQSGVLALSYSHSTPVIIRDIPAFNQYKIDDKFILPIDFNEIQIYELCNSILLNKKNYSKYELKCESAFNKYFSEQNFELFYSKLIRLLH